MKSQMMWVGRHEGLLRDVSRGCAYGDHDSLRIGATMLAPFVLSGAMLVPMPSHIGYATTMLALCREIKAVRSILYCDEATSVLDCLTCRPHESFHVMKLHGEYPEWDSVSMSVDDKADSYLRNADRPVYIIDNCIGTGTTASAALSVIRNATVLAITKG